MTAQVRQLPFGLDPLMAEAKRRAVQRRFLIALIVLALIGAVFGAVAVFRSPGGPQSSLPGALGGGSAQTGRTILADFPRFGLSFRYPAGWRRVDCPRATLMGTMGVTHLTTARGPLCSQPVPSRTSVNGVDVLWEQAPRVVRNGGNARIGGQPAQVYVRPFHRPRGGVVLGIVYCGAGAQRVITAHISGPATANYEFEMLACLRGPKLRRSQAAVGQMLASVRFYPRPKH